MDVNKQLKILLGLIIIFCFTSVLSYNAVVKPMVEEVKAEKSIVAEEGGAVDEDGAPQGRETGTEQGSGEVNGNEGGVTVSPEECIRVVELVNEERAKAGLKALVNDEKLNQISQIKADDMLAEKKMSHYSETNGYAADLLDQNGVEYAVCGENIAWGKNTFFKAEEIMTGWMKSQGHRANILRKEYVSIGVAYAKDKEGNIYWAQIFKG